MARLQALIRRVHGLSTPGIALGPLHYDSVSRVFTLNGQTLVLRPKEHAVLEVLLRDGKAISKEKLFDKVFSVDATTGQDVVEIYIHRLCKLLVDSGVVIVTLRGLGYLLELQAEPHGHGDDHDDGTA